MTKLDRSRTSAGHGGLDYPTSWSLRPWGAWSISSCRRVIVVGLHCGLSRSKLPKQRNEDLFKICVSLHLVLAL